MASLGYREAVFTCAKVFFHASGNELDEWVPAHVLIIEINTATYAVYIDLLSQAHSFPMFVGLINNSWWFNADEGACTVAWCTPTSVFKLRFETSRDFWAFMYHYAVGKNYCFDTFDHLLDRLQATARTFARNVVLEAMAAPDAREDTASEAATAPESNGGTTFDSDDDGEDDGHSNVSAVDHGLTIGAVALEDDHSEEVSGS